MTLQLLFANVEFRAVVVRQQNRRVRAGGFRHQHQRQHAAVPREIKHNLASHVAAAILLGDDFRFERR